jgi:hypothetical protein
MPKKPERLKQAHAAASAGGSQKAANAAAAASLEALVAGAGEVRALRRFKRLCPQLTLPAQAVRSDAVDGRLSYLPLRPEHGGGASVRLAPWGGHRPGSALCLAVVHSASCAYALLLPANNFWLASAGLEAILCTCLALRLVALFHL